jgi:hypothetical protein
MCFLTSSAQSSRGHFKHDSSHQGLRFGVYRGRSNERLKRRRLRCRDFCGSPHEIQQSLLRVRGEGWGVGTRPSNATSEEMSVFGNTVTFYTLAAASRSKASLFRRAFFASLNGGGHTTGGGLVILNSFLSSPTSISHRFSQYTSIRHRAPPPHFRAHGTSSFQSFINCSELSRRGPKSADKAVEGSPRLANSKNLRVSSAGTETGRKQIV